MNYDKFLTDDNDPDGTRTYDVQDRLREDNNGRILVEDDRFCSIPPNQKGLHSKTRPNSKSPKLYNLDKKVKSTGQERFIFTRV